MGALTCAAWCLAVDETSVILLHPPLPSVGVSIVMERERQQMTVSPTASGARGGALAARQPFDRHPIVRGGLDVSLQQHRQTAVPVGPELEGQPTNRAFLPTTGKPSVFPDPQSRVNQLVGSCL